MFSVQLLASQFFYMMHNISGINNLCISELMLYTRSFDVHTP